METSLSNYSKLILEDLHAIDTITDKSEDYIVYATQHGLERRQRSNHEQITNDEVNSAIRKAIPKLRDAVLNGYVIPDRRKLKMKGKIKTFNKSTFHIMDTSNNLNIIGSLSRETNSEEINIVIITIMKKFRFRSYDIATVIKL